MKKMQIGSKRMEMVVAAKVITNRILSGEKTMIISTQVGDIPVMISRDIYEDCRVNEFKDARSTEFIASIRNDGYSHAMEVCFHPEKDGKYLVFIRCLKGLIEYYLMVLSGRSYIESMLVDMVLSRYVYDDMGRDTWGRTICEQYAASKLRSNIEKKLPIYRDLVDMTFSAYSLWRSLTNKRFEMLMENQHINGNNIEAGFLHSDIDEVALYKAMAVIMSYLISDPSGERALKLLGCEENKKEEKENETC